MQDAMDRNTREQPCKSFRSDRRNKIMNSINNREQTIILLKQLQEKGYSHVVRDHEMPYLTCFSLRPKKYRDTESWGYIDQGATGARGAYSIKNTDISEVNWTNRSATLISDFLEKQHVQK